MAADFVCHPHLQAFLEAEPVLCLLLACPVPKSSADLKKRQLANTGTGYKHAHNCYEVVEANM